MIKKVNTQVMVPLWFLKMMLGEITNYKKETR